MFVLEPVEQPRVRGRRRSRVERLRPVATAKATKAAAWRSRRAPVSPRSSSLLQRVLADRLEHREADVAVEVVADADQALLREPLEAAEDVERHGRRRRSRTPTPPSRSGRRRRTRRAARTAAGPPGRAGRGSSRSRRAASAGAPGRSRPPADSSPSRSPRRWAIAAGREEPDPGGGQLDRQRQAVEPAHDLRDVRCRSRRQREVGPDGHRALDEQPHRLRRHERVRVGRRPAGGSDSGGTGNSCSPEIRSGARLETMTVSFGADRSRSATIGAPATTCSKLSSTSSAVRSLRWSLTRSIGGRCGASSPMDAAMADGTRSGSVTDASGTNQVPSGEPVDAVAREGQRQPRLARAAGAGERQQPGPVQQRHGAVDLGPPDERRQLGRQVVGREIERPERGKRGLQTVGLDLVQALRLGRSP